MPIPTEAEIDLAVHQVVAKEALATVQTVTVEVSGTYIAAAPGGKKVTSYTNVPILLPKPWDLGTVKRMAGHTLKQKFSDFVKVRTFLANPRSEKPSSVKLVKGDLMTEMDRVLREKKVREYLKDNHTKVDAILGEPVYGDEDDITVDDQVDNKTDQGVEDEIMAAADAADQKKKAKAVAKKKQPRPGAVVEADQELDDYGLPKVINDED